MIRPWCVQRQSKLRKPVNCNKTAFTLVEILIVVTILAILAAVVVPHYISAEEESKLSNLMTYHLLKDSYEK